MAISPTSPVAILNFLELALTIIVVGLISGPGCSGMGGDILYRIQFTSAVIHGHLMIHLYLVISNFADGMGKNLRLVIMATGSVLWLCASAVVLSDADQTICVGENYDRFVAGGVLGLANFVVQAADAFFVHKTL